MVKGEVCLIKTMFELKEKKKKIHVRKMRGKSLHISNLRLFALWIKRL